MKALFIALIAPLLLLCSCDDETKFCNQMSMLELAVVNSKCSDAAYLADNGYADYSECFDNDSRAVVLSIMSCKGRDGMVP